MPHNVSRVYLVGFMGAGKTTVGRELGRRLEWPFVDLDAEIERAEKLPVAEIFRQRGEPYFRALERTHLRSAAQSSGAVIALGGGAFIDPENRAIAEASGLTVWLKVSFANVLSRVTMDGTRPMFADPGRAELLYNERLPIYHMAQLHISSDERSADSIAAEIAAYVIGEAR